MKLLIHDKTRDGTEVMVAYDEIAYEDPTTWRVSVNGARIDVLQIDVFRDGGTRLLRLESDQTITLPNKAGSADRVPKLDGMDIGLVPEDVIEERAERWDRLAAVAAREAGARPRDLMDSYSSQGLFQFRTHDHRPWVYEGEIARDIAQQADNRQSLKGTTPPIDEPEERDVPWGNACLLAAAALSVLSTVFGVRTWWLMALQVGLLAAAIVFLLAERHDR